jgi:exopolysaccharide biosynthesis polyprenyl glycosylphosphotransferase
VNAVERAAILQGALLHDEMTAAVDARTLEIVDRRRRTAIVKRRGWLVRRMLLLADVVGLTLAFLLAQLLFRRGPNPFDHVDAPTELLFFVLTLPGWVVVAKLYGLYDRDEERADHTTSDDIVGVFHLVTVGAWLFYAGAWLTGLADPRFARLLTFWALATALVPLARGAARACYRQSTTYLQNTIIVGAGEVGQLVARKLLQHPEYGINLVGFVDSEPKELREELSSVALLGSPSRLPAIVRLFDIERVVIAFSTDSHERSLELIRSLKDLDVQVDIVPRLFEIVGPGVGIHTVEGLPLVGLPALRLSRSSALLKRSMDLILAGTGVLLLSPLFALVAVLIKRGSPGPVFFRQVRMGAGEKTFRIFKFRTMTADAEERKHEVAHLNKHARSGGDVRMFKIPDDPRITRVGRFLRRYSLDELPQLLNVLTGEMSLVGPRPLILDEDRHVEEWARRRLDLKPGITGPWQVLGRSDIPFEEMVKLDYLYVTGWSLFNDLKLVLRTIPLLFRNRGAY